MHILRYAAALFLGALALAASSAKADSTIEHNGWLITLTDTPINDARVAASLPIAERYWGQTADCRTLTISESLATAIAGWASRSADGECRIWIDRVVLASGNASGICSIVAHEYGHLLGRDHSPNQPGDPSHVMDSEAGLAIPPQCPKPALSMITRKRDGRTRSRWNIRDRSWCRKHQLTCVRRYPNLANGALTPSDAAAARIAAGV